MTAIPQPQTGSNDLAAARRLLASEAGALTALGDSLGDAFIAALDAIDAGTGRVVVSGMGKSGHVGRKVAATLASTGTPSFFVHAAEASHGDLGMITREDVVIALSNSGETPELSDLIAFTRRYGIPLVAITSKPESSLATASDFPLILPPTREACPLGLAPTTSTTMMLALGDAIAVTLLERRGFTADDFKVFHPGGKLGQRLFKVGDLMYTDDRLPLANLDTPMGEAILTMTTKIFGCVGVLDADGALAGIVTDGDLRRHMSDDLLNMTVKDVMTANPKVTAPDVLAAEAVRVMNEKKITSLFVIVDRRPVGILHLHECLRAGVV